MDSTTSSPVRRKWIRRVIRRAPDDRTPLVNGPHLLHVQSHPLDGGMAQLLEGLVACGKELLERLLWLVELSTERSYRLAELRLWAHRREGTTRLTCSS